MEATEQPEMQQLVADKKPSAEKKPSPDPSAQIGMPSKSNPCVLGVPDPDGSLLFMVLVSAFYALLTPWLIWRVAGEPTAFVWTTSLLASSYFFIGSICLSRTLRFFSFFFRSRGISCIALLSVAAAHFTQQQPNSVAVAVTILLTFYGAGMFGHAIAEYLQRVWIDQESDKNVVPSPEPWIRRQTKELDEPTVNFLFMQSVISLIVLVRIAWLVLHPASAIALLSLGGNEAMFIVRELSYEMIVLAFPWASFVAVNVEEETLLSESTMRYTVPVCAFVLYTLSTVLLMAVGEVAELLVLWPIAMAMVGLFGYIISLFWYYRKIALWNYLLSDEKDQQQSIVEKELDEPDQRVVVPS